MILRGEPRDALLQFIAERAGASYGAPLGAINVADAEIRSSGGAADPELRPALTLPLTAGTQVLGELTLFSRGAAAPHPDDEELRGFADQVALSIVAAADQQQIRLLTVACESAANAIVITRADGAIEWVNPAFTQLTGWTAEEVAGGNPRMLRSGNHSRAFYRQMWESLLSGQVWPAAIPT